MAVDLKQLSTRRRDEVQAVLAAYLNADDVNDELIRDGVLLYLGRNESGLREITRVVLLDESAKVIEVDHDQRSDLDRGLDAGPQSEDLEFGIGIDVGPDAKT